jgi:hypothetical protein
VLWRGTSERDNRLGRSTGTSRLPICYVLWSDLPTKTVSLSDPTEAAGDLSRDRKVRPCITTKSSPSQLNACICEIDERAALPARSFNTFPHLKTALARFNTTSGVKPWWLLPTRHKLQANGLLDDSERWAVRSDQLYISNWKMLTEAMRKSTYVSGYEW